MTSPTLHTALSDDGLKLAKQFFFCRLFLQAISWALIASTQSTPCACLDTGTWRQTKTAGKGMAEEPRAGWATGLERGQEEPIEKATILRRAGPLR